MCDLLKTRSLWIGIFLVIVILAISVGLGVTDWKPILAIMAGSLLISGLAVYKECASADDDHSDFNVSGILMVLIGMIAILFAIAFHIAKADFLIVSLAGIIGLAVPLVLALSSKVNLGSRLDNGEIRKAIVISLTIVYIILLVVSFNSTNILYKNNNTSATDNSVSFREIVLVNESVKSDHRYVVYLNGTNGGFVVKNNSSGFSFAFSPQINGSSGNIPLGENSTMIPEQALANFTSNFLYVFAVIILFYFGSRAWETSKTDDKVKTYLTSLLNPPKEGPENNNSTGTTTIPKPAACPTPLKAEDIISLRYALGDIGDREYKGMMKNMERMSGGIRIADVDFDTKESKIEISVFNANRTRDLMVEDVVVKSEEDGKNIVKQDDFKELKTLDRIVFAGGTKDILIKVSGVPPWGSMYHIKITDSIGDTDEGDYRIDSSSGKGNLMKRDCVSTG
jgi:hypothetical protein